MKELRICNLGYVTFSAILWLSCDQPDVSSEGNGSSRGKPPPNFKSLATFSQAPIPRFGTG